MTLLDHDDLYDPYNLRGQYAGFVTRLTALLIDIFILSAAYGTAALAVQAIGNFFQTDIFQRANEESWLSMIISSAVVLNLIAYFVLSWTLIGQTPGKAFMGIRIYSVDGNRLTFPQAVIRFAVYWFSASLFFVGFFWVLIDNRRQSLHDKVARTVVVYAWEARMHRFVVERAQRGVRKED